MKAIIGRYDCDGNQYVRVDINEQDIWNANTTLAQVILPTLKAFKGSKRAGFPMLSAFDYDSDNSYPQLTFPFYSETNNEVWNANSKEWEEAIDKMIYAFESYLDPEFEDQFWKIEPEIDLDHKEVDADGMIPLKWKVEGECDWEGLTEAKRKMQEGFELFGKYFVNLWD